MKFSIIKKIIIIVSKGGSYKSNENNSSLGSWDVNCLRKYK